MPGSDLLIHQVAGWRRALVWPLATLTRFWGSTLRLEMDAATRALLEKSDEPIVFALWHNRLFLAAEVYRRFRHGRRLCALISASADGAWLTAYFSALGMDAVRGSSSRLGRQAAHGMIEALRAGHDGGITPDGPRGPRYGFKPGAVVMVKASGARLLLLGCRFGSAWRFRSWDAFCLPRPFSRLEVRAELVEPEVLEQSDAASRFEARLREFSPD
ncbi:MAG TPA: DUF374 domain-containing protein [Opitutaceae bacterium]|jgi:hypothetical protein